jgi:catechol 2,3-dioxygenase-like lactoylglutathione lyase family enzyme
MFDVDKALAFYVAFLGFEEKWRHQFDESAPYYIGIERDGAFVHLTEHFGDATPGSHIRIEVRDIDAFCAQLNSKRYRNSRPGIVEQPRGNREMTIADPFGNRITFWVVADARNSVEHQPDVFARANMRGARFDDVALADARFNDVNLRDAVFTDVDLRGAKLQNVRLSGVSVADCAIDGLTIDGFDVAALVAAERTKRERPRD